MNPPYANSQVCGQEQMKRQSGAILGTGLGRTAEGPTPVRGADIPRELQSLGERTAVLDKLLTELSTRLLPARRAGPGQGAAEVAEDTPSTEVGIAIRQQRYAVERACVQLQTLLDEIEL